MAMSNNLDVISLQPFFFKCVASELELQLFLKIYYRHRTSTTITQINTSIYRGLTHYQQCYQCLHCLYYK